MKKLLILFLSFILILSGCSGSIDSQGNIISTPPVNLSFASGINWLGELASPPVSANISDAFFYTADNNSYVWNGSAWDYLALSGLQGAQGIQGITGATGATGANGTQGAQGETGGFAGIVIANFTKNLAELSTTNQYEMNHICKGAFFRAYSGGYQTFGEYDGVNYQNSMLSSFYTDRFTYLYGSAGNYQTGVPSFNGTKIDITWSRLGYPTGNQTFILIGFY